MKKKVVVGLTKEMVKERAAAAKAAKAAAAKAAKEAEKEKDAPAHNAEE